MHKEDDRYKKQPDKGQDPTVQSATQPRSTVDIRQDPLLVGVPGVERAAMSRPPSNRGPAFCFVQSKVTEMEDDSAAARNVPQGSKIVELLTADDRAAVLLVVAVEMKKVF
ncbi:hypothetical protein C1H46_022763 [Malus baccata]|uniref:Uncharacterized protein n=1 Tax=Malus baccata TaxID=106549 RepID=A0A540LZG4_MALBA|nr:hypothetical protein C1H46_022763 [Malus baccata]